MKKITITIKTTNAAFADNRGELADILTTLAAVVSLYGEPPATLKDSNGNTVGSVVYE